MCHAGRFSHDNLFCEWAAGGPVILVWNRCSVNGQLVDQLSWYRTGALYWFETEALWCGQV